MYKEFMAILDHVKVNSDEAFFDGMFYVAGLPFWKRWGYYLYTFTWFSNWETGRRVRTVYLAYILLLRMQYYIFKRRIARWFCLYFLGCHEKCEATLTFCRKLVWRSKSSNKKLLRRN
jgi:hypothetical protein